MKIKTIFLCVLLSTSSLAHALSDGQAAILGLVIGNHIGQNNQRGQEQQRAPIVVHREYAPVYRSPSSGYCDGYRGDQYVACLENMAQKRHEDLYYRNTR